MDNRQKLQSLLEQITPNVYFQAPSNKTMVYPAIVYSRKNIDNLHANDNIYGSNTAYEVTVIDKNPDSLIAKAILKMKYSRLDRQFVNDGLNHIVIKIYY